jgi:hypothetical protein
MRRMMIWVENQRDMGWGCSECGWLFKPSGSPSGESLDEMTQVFLLQRDKEFTAHLCVEHPKPKQAQPFKR